MARGTTAGSEAYTGMLAVAVFGMVVGIFCLVMEAGEYDWASKPAAAVPDPKGQLPKPPAPAGGAALLEPEPAKPAVAAKPPEAPKPTDLKPAEPKPEVVAKPSEEPKPLPKSATPAAVEEKKPDGPTPSPIQIRPRR